MSITTAAATWNLAEYNTRPEPALTPIRPTPNLRRLGCLCLIRLLAHRARRAAQTGDTAEVERLRDQANDLIDAELAPPVILRFDITDAARQAFDDYAPPAYGTPEPDTRDSGSPPLPPDDPAPTRNPILDSAIDSLEAQAAEAEALLRVYAAQGRQNSPGVDELKYQRSIRDLSRKAADLLRVEGLPERTKGGWIVTSARNTYVVSDATPRRCDCRAGREGLRCKHKLAVEAVDRVQAVQQRKAA